MKSRSGLSILCLGLTAAACMAIAAPSRASDAAAGASDAAPAPNALSPAERAAGWRLIFDGATSAGWRGYRAEKFPSSGWTVENGSLKTTGGGGDIVTAAEYGDFELSLEWKAAPKANSGIMYRVAETLDAPWQTGPEFQILDDAGHGLAATDPHSAGALYDMAPPAPEKVVHPAGEWNHARVRLKDGLLTHWVNGVKVVECRADDASWAARIAGSKFKDYAGFGVQPRGRIAIQDHGDTVWFRSIKVRDLSEKMPGEVELFNGRDLSGWTAFVPDLAAKGQDPASVWSVREGVLVCSGNPAGYLKTGSAYESYVLKLEWRWSPATKQEGNSGVLLRLAGEDRVWPTSVEAQLHSGNAGDFWCIGDYPMKTDPARTNGRNTKKLAFNERPVGEWNEYEIIVDGPTVVLLVNGHELNRAWDVKVGAGPIALQSEGTEIHFRRVRLAPIGR